MYIGDSITETTSSSQLPPLLVYRVTSGKFGHQVKFGHTFVNSVNPDETAPYPVCLVNLFFIPIFEI